MAHFIVTTGSDDTADDAVLSLREAIALAELTAEADTIAFRDDVDRIELAEGPLVIQAGRGIAIQGDRDGDAIPDITIDGNAATHHFTVEAGAALVISGLNLVAGRGVGSAGASGSEGSDGANGSYGGPISWGPAGEDGGDGLQGGNGGNAAGSILNYGTLTIERSQFAGNTAFGGSGGSGGAGGDGGYGAQGGVGFMYGFAGGEGGDGGRGGAGGRGGDGGHAAGAILNGSGAVLNLVDTVFGPTINVGDAYDDEGGFRYGSYSYAGNRAVAGIAGSGGSGGHGGAGGNGGGGEFGGFVDQTSMGPGGDGGSGGDGGQGGRGGNSGASGSAAGAILNFGTINSATIQSMSGNRATGPLVVAAGGSGGTGGVAGIGGGEGFGEPPGEVGDAGTMGSTGSAGIRTAAGSTSAGYLNTGAGTTPSALISSGSTDTLFFAHARDNLVPEAPFGTSRPIEFLVTRFGDAPYAETVAWQVQVWGNGVPGQTIYWGSLTFEPGAVQMSVQLDVYNAIPDDGDAVYRLALVGVYGWNGRIGTATSTITVTDATPVVGRFSSLASPALVEDYIGENAFARALADAADGQHVEVYSGNVWGDQGEQTVSADRLTIAAYASTGFTSTLRMLGEAYHLTLAGDANMVVTGNAGGANAISGGSGNDAITGRGGHDTLDGGSGRDTLVGGGGDDLIAGGSGADLMTGGAGMDRFVFASAGEIGIGAGSRDIVTDFQVGTDSLDLTFDANSRMASWQDFTWIGSKAHTGSGGTLRYENRNGNTLVSGDVDGDGSPDFVIQLTGTLTLSATDFAAGSIGTIEGSAGGDSITGTHNAETLLGLGGNDALAGSGGNDTLKGGNGADTLTGGSGRDVFAFALFEESTVGKSGRDVVTDFQRGQDIIDLSALDASWLAAGVQDFIFVGTSAHPGMAGSLRYQHSGGSTFVFADMNGDGSGDFGIEIAGLHALDARDFAAGSIRAVHGSALPDILFGGAGGERIYGFDGDDTIEGGDGADTIYGGAGTDVMTGGSGADVFVWTTAAHTGAAAGARDVIADFTPGVDRIDLSAIDANTRLSGHQSFSFVGTDVHDGSGGTLRCLQAGGNTIIFGDRDGDRSGDFAIQLTGLYTLTAADFIL